MSEREVNFSTADLDLLNPIMSPRLPAMLAGRALRHSLSRPQVPSLCTRTFSVSCPRKIMELSGFSEEQLSVRDAMFKICSNFSDVNLI